ncbi:TPA: hypothetical protein HA270_05970 [Candidatus Woesearchaeota archaeon]|nr:hypothetical protein [Candidatus Woesearchaeota archaeon]
MAKKEIENYIEKSLKKGYSATKIKKNLVAVGHKLEHIEHALAVVQERLETEASEEESSARLRRKLWMQIGIACAFIIIVAGLAVLIDNMEKEGRIIAYQAVGNFQKQAAEAMTSGEPLKDQDNAQGLEQEGQEGDIPPELVELLVIAQTEGPQALQEEIDARKEEAQVQEKSRQEECQEYCGGSVLCLDLCVYEDVAMESLSEGAEHCSSITVDSAKASCELFVTQNAYGFPPEFCLELTGTPAAHCYANLQS